MQKYFSDAINTILINDSDTEDAIITVVNGISQLQQKYELVK